MKRKKIGICAQCKQPFVTLVSKTWTHAAGAEREYHSTRCTACETKNSAESHLRRARNLADRVPGLRARTARGVEKAKLQKLPHCERCAQGKSCSILDV
jgi:hypothetical protein